MPLIISRTRWRDGKGNEATIWCKLLHAIRINADEWGPQRGESLGKQGEISGPASQDAKPLE